MAPRYLTKLNFAAFLILPKALSYDKDLNLPCLKWIGLKLSDLDYFQLKNGKKYMLELNLRDKKIAENLKSELKKFHQYSIIKEVQLK